VARWIVVDMEPNAVPVVRSPRGTVTFRGTGSFRFEAPRGRRFTPHAVTTPELMPLLPGRRRTEEPR
jgi:hypothetical protein